MVIPKNVCLMTVLFFFTFIVLSEECHAKSKIFSGPQKGIEGCRLNTVKACQNKYRAPKRTNRSSQISANNTFLSVFNTETNKRIGPLLNGQVLNFSTGRYAICLDQSGAESVRSILFRTNGRDYRVESARPFCQDGDGRGGPRAITLANGTYTFQAKLFSGIHTGGALLKTISYSFTVANKGAVHPTPTPTATKTPTPTSTPTATPPQVGNSSVPQATIFSENDIVNSEVRGQAPLTLHVRGFYDFYSIPSYENCRNMLLSQSTGNYRNYLDEGYLSVGHPNRAAWEHQGDTFSRCIESVESELNRKNELLLGRGNTPQSVHYEWNFEDTNQNGSMREFTQQKGGVASYTYEQPGTHSVSLTVTNKQGITARKRVLVVVTAPTRRKIFMSTSGNDTNNGSSDATPIRSFAKLRQLTGSGNTAADLILRNNYEVLLRRGDTFHVGTRVTDGSIVVEGRNIVISAYGNITQPRPKLLWRDDGSNGKTAISIRNVSREVLVENISFDSDLTTAAALDESLTPPAINPTSSAKLKLPTAIATNGDLVTLRNLDFLNVQLGIRAQRSISASGYNKPPQGLLIFNSSAPLVGGLRSYFLWNGGGRNVVLIKNYAANSTVEHIARSAELWSGLGAYHNTFQNLQYAGSTDLSIAGNSGIQGDDAKGIFTIQGGQFAWILNNKIPFGPSGCGPLGGNTGTRGVSTKYVTYDSNIISLGMIVVESGCHHLVISNNTIGTGRTPTTPGYTTALEVKGYNGDHNIVSRGILIAHNTLHAPRGDSSNDIIGMTGKKFIEVRHSSEQVQVINNLLLAPDFRASERGSSPILLEVDGLRGSSAKPSIDLVACNTIPIPGFYRGGRYNSQDINHGINEVRYIREPLSSMQDWLQPIEWQTLLETKRGGRRIDRFAGVEFTRAAQGTIIPGRVEASGLRCESAPGILYDSLGVRRNNTTVTAGALELEQ